MIHFWCVRETRSHTVDYDGYVGPILWGLRDQFCTTQGLEVQLRVGNLILDERHLVHRVGQIESSPRDAASCMHLPED